MINDVASVILWLIVALFILHLIEGDAKEWVWSKFKPAVPWVDLGPNLTDPTAGTTGSKPTNPSAGFNQPK